MLKLKDLDKTFCELSKSEIEKYDEEIRNLIKKPKYFCKKCLRSSSEKSYICKHEKF
jgi:hypothetical protein